jgi:hypothetical protein
MEPVRQICPCILSLELAHLFGIAGNRLRGVAPASNSTVNCISEMHIIAFVSKGSLGDISLWAEMHSFRASLFYGAQL